jgi:hypothetical protein
LTSASFLVLFLHEHAAGHPEGRRRGVAARPHPALPLLRRAPPLAARIAGKFVVACENEDCTANPQVCAPTLDEAWTRWNIRRAA